jgi:RNA methyltransferase, TrmH family
MKHIQSPANTTLKAIRKLHNRKAREESDLFFVEGIRIVADAIEHSNSVQRVYFCPALLNSDFAQRKIEQALAQNIEVIELSEAAFLSIAAKDNPQGIAAVASRNYMSLADIAVQQDDVWVVLDTIRDPGNVGTILRTLDGVNGTGIILLDDCVDAYDPTAVRASMGAIFTRKILKATFHEFTEWKIANTFALVGTSDHEGRHHYRDFSYPAPTFLLMGSEREGLPEAHVSLCENLVYIPMRGVCDSLNLAIATGIILYEVLHQRMEGI